jgi:hypothetical protein
MNLRSWLAVLTVTLATVAGCGSSSSSKGAAAPVSSAVPAAPTASTVPASVSAPVQATASAQASASAAAPSASQPAIAPAPAATSAAPVNTLGGGSLSDFCKAISTTEGILTTAATSPHDPTLPEMLKRLHTLAASAPSAVRGDLAAIADFDQKIVDALETGKSPDIAETPALKASLLHEALWVQKNCH